MTPSVLPCREVKKIHDQVKNAFNQVHAERCRKWRAENPEASREATRRWVEKNAEDKKLASRLWRFFNRERVRQYNREWRARNPNYQRERRARLKAAK